MERSDLIYMILDNVLVFNITLPPEFEGNNLHDHLNKFEDNSLKIIAGFNKNFLEHFIKISNGKSQQDISDPLKKMEKISYMVGPIGTLNYITSEQIDHILKKMDSLKLDEINEEKISIIADELLRQQFGGESSYSTSDALESQLSSAAFYLMNMGYSREEIQEKFNDVRDDPSKLDSLFTLPQKEIYSTPNEIQQEHMESPPSHQEPEINQIQGLDEAIAKHIQAIHQDITEERAEKVDEILTLIKDHVKDNMSELQEKVFRQMHPDRLNRALKMLKTTKRNSKRMRLYLEWFTESFLLSKIELKVEHWQVSSSSQIGSAGVYTAGIDFSRYDNIIRDFPDPKLEKVITVVRRILQNPSKKAIQKIATDLVAETGFDEHLYFTD
ncbi:MAG: hypothetical protein ACFE9R_00700 [Candidatus Hermodarchaeota archaeon]